jgi:hypothetical protein
MKARSVVIAAAIVALGGAACSDDDSSAKKSSSSTTTSTSSSTTTTTTIAATTTSAAPVTTQAPPTTVEPATCNGAAGVEPDLKALYVSQGIVANPNDIVVSNVRIAGANSRYASASTFPARPDVLVQGAYTILQCPEVGGAGTPPVWQIVDEGTGDGIGCDLPPGVREELGQGC